MTEPVSAELIPLCQQPGCRVVARPSQPLCDSHAVEQRLLAAQRALAEHAPMAAATLIELCESSAQADVRRRAAEAILDRIGVRPGVELKVSHEVTRTSAAERIRDQLDRLHAAAEGNKRNPRFDEVSVAAEER